MTISTILGVLVLGIAILTIGFFAKKRWIQLISIVPLVIAGWQFLRLFMMS
ncbi:hypothetical protein [Bacillus sp. B-jedd]|uniref:hypothetical protein n=1 Tax=Bacillus sp. B-jedd TaxID=1476857 RepID=UPI0005155EF1|nr:hypothetical protein [Bacillus sp. B-jedd]CEG27109.1 hypothetical protein BN1002_01965 [Bacillus sp. B-jedd]